MLSPGRNGGHLAADPFSRFRERKAALGVKEALRGYELERYTVEQLLRIISEEKLEKTIDLVHGGRIDLLLTTYEYQETRADYESAKTAGLDLNGVEWLDEEYMQKASLT